MLKCKRFCSDCNEETIHEWVGMDESEWIFHCTKCETDWYERDPRVWWIEDQNEKKSRR